MSTLAPRFLCLIGLIGFLCVLNFNGQVITVQEPSSWHKSPVDNERMNARISDAAEKYKSYAPIPRIAFFDIGYPKDSVEFKELNGYGVLLVSSMSQDASELPLKRVFFSSDGRNSELTFLKEYRSTLTSTDSQTAKTFGLYRVDSLYLFPVYFRFQKGELKVDFSKNREGMKLTEFDGEDPANLVNLPKTKPSEGKLADEKIKRFLKREYPGYSEN